MAKFKGKGVVVAGLLAGAASFLSKKENRDKAMEFLNEARTKTTNNFQEGSTNMEIGNEIGVIAKDVAETAASPKTLNINENEFINEGGAQKMINDYNFQQHKQ